MSLIFYSSYIPSINTLFIGEDFLKTIESTFNDSIVCVGIQKGSIPEWDIIIEEYKGKGLDIHYGHINDGLYVNSDVSGFQKALEIYCKDLNYKEFDGCVWFGHSKGVTSGNIPYHKFIMKYFWYRRDMLEKSLMFNDEIGSYSFYLSLIPEYTNSNINNIWGDYTDFKFTKKSINYMYTNTFFMCKKEPFLNVFKKIKDKFFSEKLVGVSEIGDRYFFERDFIHFIDMQNLLPSYEELAINNVCKNPTKEKLNNEIELWKRN
tara:strand:- start:1066 stop:1854 length:789 start_codon:yes stop_codon:yes gene_type:complete